MEAPLVSILIPSYKPRHFEAALTSAVAQDYPNKEVIVSDDCPTDDIRRICEPYAKVRYSRNPERGPNTNLRRLTRLAEGKYLKYLMDDDILHPLCVRRMVDVLEQDPGLKLVFSARDRIGEDSRIISQERAIQSSGPMTRLAGATIRRHCVKNVVNIVGEFTTVLFRRSDVHRPDGEVIYTSYHGDPIVGLTDIATFLQLCESGDAAYLSDALSMFRIHDAANTRNVASPGVLAGLAEWALFAKHACADPDFSDEDKRTAVANTRARLERWAQRFPPLAAQVELLDELMRQLDGARHSPLSGGAPEVLPPHDGER